MSGDDVAKESASHSRKFKRYTLLIPIKNTLSVTAGLAGPEDLEFYNSNNGAIFKFEGVQHWAWNGKKMYVFPAEDMTAKQFNKVFKEDDTLTVRRTPELVPKDDDEPDNDGEYDYEYMPYDDDWEYGEYEDAEFEYDDDY